MVTRSGRGQPIRWRMLGPERPEPFDLELSGVRELTLETVDAGDGEAADRGAWFEPRLTRR